MAKAKATPRKAPKEIKRLSDLKTQRNNLNKHKPHGLKALGDSVQKDGLIGGITVAADGEAFDGSARLETIAETMPGVKIRVVDTEGDTLVVNRRVDIPNTNDPRAKRLGYAANAIGVMDWNPDAELLAQLAVEDDLVAALAKQENESLKVLRESDGSGSADAEPQIDKAEELNERWKVGRGDLFVIGDHRLICGDSASTDDIQRLMEGKRATLFATDPPYGISYDSASLHRNETRYDEIEMDELRDEKLQSFLTGIFSAWAGQALTENAAWYLWHAMLTQGFFAAAAAADIILHRQIIWRKPQFVFGRGDYHWRHEICFYGWRKGKRPPFYGEHNQDTVWEVGYDGKRNDRIHPTEKPPALWDAPMKNNTQAGEICAEPFAGSGSQFVAGQNSGRIVYGCEIEPKYCAVILERMITAFPHLDIHRA